MKVAIIGSGNMGGALARAWINQKIFPAENITCTAKTAGTLEKLKNEFSTINTTGDNAAAVVDADLILLCVKPWLIASIAQTISKHVRAGTTIVSVAAGVSLDTLESLFGNEKKIKFYRVIPNTALACEQSMTFIATRDGNAKTTLDVPALFEKLGKVKIIDESKMAAGTALASCGIAYGMRYIRAASEGGVELGFTPTEAREIVLQTLRGAVELLETSGLNPEAAIDQVTTPGGLTIRGLNAMETAGFTAAVIAGLKTSNK